VSKGGLLFEYYLLIYGSPGIVQILANRRQEGTPCSREENDRLQDEYSLSFWYWLCVGMHMVNRKCTHPLAHWSLIQEYRGLSLVGRQIEAALGASLDRRTYTRIKTKYLTTYDEFVADLHSRNVGIIVSDNYNHNWRLEGLRLDTQLPFASVNLMVNAVQALPGSAGEEGNAYPLVLLGDDHVLPSVPSQLVDLREPFNEVLISFT
jgi:hypothetical protein